MTRRITALLSALALAGAALFTGAGGVVLPVAFAGYSCYAGPIPENNYHVYLQEGGNSYTGTAYDAARGQVVIRSQAPCVGSDNQGASLVVLATVEGNSTAGGNEAQCFWGAVTNTGSLGYYYTPNNDGALYPFPNTVRAALGDTVECLIEADTLGSTLEWRYIIHNITSGQQDTEYSPRSGAGGFRTWYGYEVDNGADQLGGPSISLPDEVTMLGYSTSSSSNWFYKTNDTVYDTCCGGSESYWHVWNTTSGSAPHYSILNAYSH